MILDAFMLARLRQRLPDPRTCQLLGLCVAVALGLDFLYFTGFYASDDVHYLETARQLASLGSDLDGFSWQSSIANTRLGLNVPSGLVYWISDGDVAVIAWFHVVYHLALVVLAYAIGRELHDTRTGLIAAALIAVNPVLYLHAGAVLPDNATAVWLGVLLLMLLRARRRAVDAPLSTGEAFRRYFVAGLVLGVAYACKETALIMTVAGAITIVAAAPRVRSTVWIRDGAMLAAGLLAFVVLEAVLLRLLSDQWLSRIGEVQHAGDTFADRMTRQGSWPHERFSHLWSRAFRPLMPVTIVLLLASALVFPLLRRRNAAVLAFFWWPLLYMTIGSTNFSDYRPSSIQARYYAIIMIPAAVMTAVVLATLLERWASRRWAAGALVVALGVTTLYEARHNLGLGGNLYRCANARAFVTAYQQARSEYPEHPIVLSEYYRRLMTPMLYPRAPANVFAHPSLTSWDPEPVLPYILLSPLGDALPEDRSVQTLAIVYPARRRLDILVDSLRGVLGWSRRPVPLGSRGAVVIQLVMLPELDAAVPSP